MISVCCAVNRSPAWDKEIQRYTPFQHTEEVLLDSIAKKSPLITEVMLVYSHSFQPLTRQYPFQVHQEEIIRPPGVFHGFYHALALHQALDKTTNEYVMFCDCDVFFWSDVAQLYYDVMMKNQVHFVGVSHHGAGEAFKQFPTVINSLVRKSDLPPPHWLQGSLMPRRGLYVKPEHQEVTGPPLDGKFLIQCAIPNICNQYPNPRGHFDVGCNLWYWAKLASWRWVAFQIEADSHNYTTNKQTTHPPMTLALPSQRLIYHKSATGEISKYAAAYGAG
jgi:hypothetical protein